MTPEGAATKLQIIKNLSQSDGRIRYRNTAIGIRM